MLSSLNVLTLRRLVNAGIVKNARIHITVRTFQFETLSCPMPQGFRSILVIIYQESKDDTRLPIHGQIGITGNVLFQNHSLNLQDYKSKNHRLANRSRF